MFLIITKIVSDDGSRQTQTSEVHSSTLRIGRDRSNDLHLDDPSVQPHHAVIEAINRAYILRDLNYVSLTSVDGVPVKETILNENGTIRIGRYALKFRRSTLTSSLTIEYEDIIVPAPSEVAQRVPASGAPGAPTGETGGDGTPSDVIASDKTPNVTARPGLFSKAPRATGFETRPSSADAYRLRARYLNKTTLTLGAVGLVLAVAGLAVWLDKRTVLMPGPVSTKHASFVNECVRCHAPGTRFRADIPDSTCLACHQIPTHFADHSLAPPPQCTTCHLVHKGNTMLANTTGKDCLRCHMDLKVRNPTFDITTSITDFSISHPEFAITVHEAGEPVRVRLNDAARLKDSSMIRLNHRLHLDPDLPGLSSGALQCVSCHRQGERQAALIPPVKYETACMGCHALDFDSRYPDKQVSHGKEPQDIDAELKIFYGGSGVTAASQGGGRFPPHQIQEQVDKAEAKLFGKKGLRAPGKCQLCHVADTTETGFPLIAKPSIPERWFINGTFDHAAHTMSKCIDCHEAAVHSEATADVLLPKVSTCRQCHNNQGSARDTCLECHLFHESPRKQKPGVALSAP